MAAGLSPAVPAVETSVWTTISQGASDLLSWLDQNVWQAVSAFFQGCYQHVVNHPTDIAWGLGGFAVGLSIAAISVIFFCPPAGASSGQAPGAAPTAPNAPAPTPLAT